MPKRAAALFIILFAVSLALCAHAQQSPQSFTTHGNQVRYVQGTIELQGEAESLFPDPTDYSFEDPAVMLNPYGNSPLSALVFFSTPTPQAVTVSIQGKDALSTFTHEFSAATCHRLPIYGLYADTINHVTICAEGRETQLEITTEPLPKDMPLPQITHSERDRLTNDLYFMSPSSSAYTCAVDVNGDIRWYLTGSYTWAIHRLKNGRLMLSSDRLMQRPYYVTGLYEMDLLGKVYREYTLPGGYHHDYFEMPSGNLLVASNDFTSGTVEDVIVEVERFSGDIIKTISLKDILPQSAAKSENWIAHDWFHNNSVWYDEPTNSILLSGRHQDAVISIDYETGDLNYIIGSSEGWPAEMQQYFLTPVGELEWQWSQHDASVLPNGDILIFDNGNNRAKNPEEYIPAESNYSRAVQYRIDLNSKTIEQVFSYGKERGAAYYSPYISNADYLGDAHYLVHSGGVSYTNGAINNQPAGTSNADTLYSYTTEVLDETEIWECRLEGNYYRAKKMPLYAANAGFCLGAAERLGSFLPTREYVEHIDIENPVLDEAWNAEHGITVSQEHDRVVFESKFNREDSVQLVFWNGQTSHAYPIRVSGITYTAMCVFLFEESTDNMSVSAYIHHEGLAGNYQLYLNINNTLYDLNTYVTIPDSAEPEKLKLISDLELIYNSPIQIGFYGKESQRHILKECFSLCESYESLLSSSQKESDIYALNHGLRSCVSEETLNVIRKGLYYSALSQGSFDITIGPLTGLWRFTAENPVVPFAEKLSEATESVGYEYVSIEGNQVLFSKPGMQLDVGGIAKGYIADRVKDLMIERGIEHGYINLGGNLLCIGQAPGQTPFRVAVVRPYHRNEALEYLAVDDYSVVTAGVYEQYFDFNGKRYHHILNPKTGYPFDNELNAVLIASKASVDGDALSTVCYTLGLKEGLALVEGLDDTYAAFILKNDEIVYSDGFLDAVPVYKESID
ncbi:MAG: aryl-sulfate sulfotransferase [Christensenellales bacterium]|jgi:arylsulfate sulfotransferase